MKKGTTTHPKFRRLTKMLKRPAYADARTFEIGKRKLRKSFKRIQFVDVSKLSETERASHTKNLINQSRQIQAMRQTQIEIKLTEHKRTTPIRLE